MKGRGCICGRRDVGRGDWEKRRDGKLRSECHIGEKKGKDRSQVSEGEEREQKRWERRGGERRTKTFIWNGQMLQDPSSKAWSHVEYVRAHNPVYAKIRFPYNVF